MSVIITEIGYAGKPMYGDPYIRGPKVQLTGTTGVTDIKGGHPVGYMTGRTNELDRCDTAALIAHCGGQARAPKRAEMKGTVTDPLIDYVYSADETLRGYLLVPGYTAYWRCVDNTTNIVLFDTLDLTTTMTIRHMLDSAATVAGGTTLMVAHGGDGSAAYSIPGENIPLSPKFMALIARSTTATESWMPAMFLGR